MKGPFKNQIVTQLYFSKAKNNVNAKYAGAGG